MVKLVNLLLSAYSAEDAARILRKKSRDIAGILGYEGRSEMIHRDDMALSPGGGG